MLPISIIKKLRQNLNEYNETEKSSTFQSLKMPPNHL